jgi:hypothetical protein
MFYKNETLAMRLKNLDSWTSDVQLCWELCFTIFDFWCSIEVIEMKAFEVSVDNLIK